jgi:hypothetical protein
MIMKNCPKCNRTFEDSFTFCLVDGAVLSAPYDPQATQPRPTQRITDPAPTEMFSPASKPANQTPSLYPTIAAPPPPLYSEKQQYHPQEKRSVKTGLIIGVGILVVVIFAAIVSFMLFGKANSVDNQSKTTPINNNASANKTSSKPASCFAEDAGAGVKEREEHFSWAQQQDATTLEKNLVHKADLLFHCPAMSDLGLSSAFADISVATARYVPDAKCFDGDAGVVNANRAGHKDAFREDPERNERLLKNLKWKMGAALKCLDQHKQSSYFADVSILIANAPQ